MTSKADALKERIARALYVSWWTDHIQDPSASYDHPLNEDAREACESAAYAILPILDSACAEAWMVGEQAGARQSESLHAGRFRPERNPYREEPTR